MELAKRNVLHEVYSNGVNCERARHLKNLEVFSVTWKISRMK